MTPEQIKGLRALFAKATPGPWWPVNHDIETTKFADAKGDSLGMLMHTHLLGRRHQGEAEANRDLIVATINALPALLDLAERAATAREAAIRECVLEIEKVPYALENGEEYQFGRCAAIHDAKARLLALLEKQP